MCPPQCSECELENARGARHFPTLMTLAMGGKIPWQDPDEWTYECPDRHNLVTFSIKRKK